MTTVDKVERHTKETELNEESEDASKEEQADPGSPKQQSKKKKKKTGSTRRRTKTGCLTCRQRRVKCDETKPTCRNCDKSRRQCAGYQPTPVQLSQQVPQAFPLEHSFHQYQTPSGLSPGVHPQFSPSSPQHSIEGISPPLSQTQQQTNFAVTHPMTYNHAEREWPYLSEYSFVDDTARWSPGQGSWVNASMPSSQSYIYGMHAGGTSAVHANVYSPYPGRPCPQPPNIDTSHPQNHVMSRSASSISLQRDHSATRTDLGKFSSRRERPEIASATSSRPSLTSTFDSAMPPRDFDTQLAPTRIHSFQADEEEDPNDPYDVETDNETNDQNALINFRSTQNLILDERMAYLLRHFCNILRPCISIFERPVLHDGSSTWAEKLPRLALSSRGLLHGMMAVSALHLAVLHRTSEVIPLKHFVIASRKLNRLLQTPSKRHNLETLCLCLLLAFYSVMLGDHAKWMMHLKGCSAFLMEHDFAGMACKVRNLVALRKADCQDTPHGNARNKRPGCGTTARLSSALVFDQDWELDEDLIGKLTGLGIDYPEQEQLSTRKEAQTDPTAHDVEDWTTKMDLLFWYLKMDIFQSTLSGDRLLLPYDRWKYFLPRGKIGCATSVYATVDHLWLVLGRLADFGAKDRVRKQLKITASGGPWAPDPMYFAPPQRPPKVERKYKQDHDVSNAQTQHPPSANEGRARAPKTANNAPKSRRTPPMFYGMMPPPKIPPSMLTEFHIMDTELRRSTTPDLPKATKSEDVNVELQTQHALAEHTAIAEALETWKSALDSDFEALPSKLNSTNAPFAPTLRYTDPMIACMWAFYHLGKILLRRYHPASPPAMMVSAAVNAPFTRGDAQAIGRINAGLLEGQAELATAGSMNPTLVAALQEITFPLMFAGVQYQDPAERSWTIDNLLDVAKDSGWKSGFSVASALETAWTAQGNYERTLTQRSPTDARRYDPAVSASGDVAITAEEQHESRFDSHDRRLIDRFSDLRAYWAVGVISTSNDIEQMLGELKINRDS